MKTIPLEDNVGDVLAKAQRGLQISDSQLAERIGLAVEEIQAAREGNANGEVLSKLASVLNLDGGALGRLGSGDPSEEAVPLLDGLAQFNTRYGDMTVNAYLVWDAETRGAIIFDSGADAEEMLRRVKADRLQVKYVLLTHAHPDHVADLAAILQTTKAPVYLSENETTDGAKPLLEGERFTVGSLEVEARLTSGHSAGGMTFVVSGLTSLVAIVGDSMFASSMGGGAVSYEDALKNNLEKILTLPDETIICPGHGPITTVGREKRENPFFAGKA